MENTQVGLDDDRRKIATLKVKRILEWANTNDNFDSTFIADMGDRLTEEKPMSDKQLAAIGNIYDRFGIEEWTANHKGN